MLGIIRQVSSPPIPLASGDSIASEGGTTGVHAIELEDDSEQRLPLTYKHGGWWLSPDAS